MSVINDNLVLICGEAIQGKSASFVNLVQPDGVMYLNCEAGKKLPFPSKFKELVVTDPYQIQQAMGEAESMPEIHTIIIDSQTFLMNMFESLHVLPAADTMKGWSNYAQYFKNLMQVNVAMSTKNVIFTAHVETMLNEEKMEKERRVPIKGALAKVGVESFFSCIVTARKETLDKLEAYDNPLLTITDDDRLVGYKHVFQTRPTKETVGERGMRAPMGMWSVKETFINNDCQMLINRLIEFYK